MYQKSFICYLFELIIILLLLLLLPVGTRAETISSETENSTAAVSGITINDYYNSVADNGTLFLPVTTTVANATLTCSSSNTSVATVCMSGNNVMVMAINPGVTSVYVSCITEDGVLHFDTCLVYVYMQSGVYYIRNESTDYCIETENACINNFANVQMNDEETSVTNKPGRFCQLWKITYLGSGYYSIRPLHNLSMGLYLSGNDVCIYSIGTSDTLSGVPTAAQWKLDCKNGAFVFYNRSQSAKLITIQNGSSAIGAQLIGQTYSSTNTSQQWIFEAESNHIMQPFIYDGTGHIADTVYLALDETRAFSYDNESSFLRVVNYALDLSSPSLYFVPGGNSIIRVDASSKNITGLNAGTSTVSAEWHINGHTYSDAFYVEVMPIANGTYFLQNKQTRQYARVEANSAGTQIYQGAFTGENRQRWTITHLGDGSYSIKQYSGGYLGVINNSSGLDVNVVLHSSATSSGTQWYIDTTTSGAYKLTAKCGVANDYVLATESSETTNDVKLIQGDYILNNSYRDEWIIYAPQYTLSVMHYYDLGYEARFGNAQVNIEEYQSICSAVFLELFNLDTTASVSWYTSCADICTGTPVAFADLSSNCTHENIDHKTASALCSDLRTQFGVGTDSTVLATWTGHVLDNNRCDSSSNTHTIRLSIHATTYENANYTNKPTAVIRYESIFSLLHELSHQLGAPDHYCYDLSSSNCGNPTNDCWRCDNYLEEEPVCIMDRRMDDIESRLNSGNLEGLYCDQCLSSSNEKGIPYQLALRLEQEN